MKTVGDLGEDGLIAKLCDGLETRENILVGPGDDCAVVEVGDELVLLKTDAVIEGVHFLSEEDPKRIGWKAVARVLSDFAAMGGEPGEFLVTIALSQTTPLQKISTIYQGMRNCLARFGGVIVGGETSSLPDGAPLMISIAGRGSVTPERLVTRSGGRVGDAIYVTGRLGGSIRGKHLDFEPRLREAAWLTENCQLTAMMDLSDGLGKDLPRLAAASGCGYFVDNDLIPRNADLTIDQAIGDGEDYELLLTAPDLSDQISEWRHAFPELGLTRIGELRSVTDQEISGGWGHF